MAVREGDVMTNTEIIIKALENCSNENNCAECPYRDKRFEPDTSCAEELMKLAAETIKSLTAENERLQIRNKALTEITNNYDWKFEKAKTEAYKEFSDRVINEAYDVNGVDVVDVYDIYGIAKELTEHKETVSMIDGHIEE